ncbi:DUF2236 domain-containing protein [Acidiferrimicrobium sp. IK]|uniref:oxygenase MpaB family protein n=1 Tax=Acidiferrimicrobium sp. IK TaxID=2871700 RepID=UPI0021CB9050|nr:oxygenase MpaB family protein [Acidiferrimicrobium sp. IK]MCU4186606.1 DUF2236 domain-containing protein [Acidiferrimicrobium sp. IK]
MTGISRRQLLVGGGALGALGALGLAGPAFAWSWSPSESVAGHGAGADPAWVWDDAADPVLAAVLKRGDVAKVNALLAGWVHNQDPVPHGLPSDVAGLIDSARQMPPWADANKLALAAQFNKKRGLYLGVVYGLGSGMLSTLIPHEARAVYYSKGGANMKDRVSKTAKLGYDIGSLDAYLPQGQMVVTAVKTRLVHAAVRSLLPTSSYWKTTADETRPISQRDMLVTLHSLATFAMKTLTGWKVPIPTDEADAFLHSWQVSAHMLGIRDEYIPATWDGMYSQYEQVLGPVLAPTAEGLDLANVLFDLGSQVDGGIASRPFMESMTRYVLEDKYAQWLQIPYHPGLDQFIAVGWPASIAFREATLPLPVAPDGYWTFDEFLRRAALFYLSNGQQIDITIPDVNRTTF